MGRPLGGRERRVRDREADEEPRGVDAGLRREADQAPVAAGAGGRGDDERGTRQGCRELDELGVH
jgi:hypothetical protein